jgi:hypothetical protein
LILWGIFLLIKIKAQDGGGGKQERKKESPQSFRFAG